MRPEISGFSAAFSALATLTTCGCTAEARGRGSAASEDADQSGAYGTQRVDSPNNVPGAREGAAMWIDLSGNLWLFGGSNAFSVAFGGPFNDLWRFQPLEQLAFLLSLGTHCSRDCPLDAHFGITGANLSRKTRVKSVFNS